MVIGGVGYKGRKGVREDKGEGVLGPESGKVKDVLMKVINE